MARRVGVLLSGMLSGGGSHIHGILNHPGYDIVIVIATESCPGIQIAEGYEIQNFVMPRPDSSDEAVLREYSRNLDAYLRHARVEAVVMMNFDPPLAFPLSDEFEELDVTKIAG